MNARNTVPSTLATEEEHNLSSLLSQVDLGRLRMFSPHDMAGTLLPGNTDGQVAAADHNANFLPDEIIEKIFQPLLRRRLSQPDSIACPDWADYLTLSKRFYAILRPIWLSDLHVSGDLLDSTVLQTLMHEPDLCACLRSLKITLGRGMPFALSALLNASANLQEVVIDFEPAVLRDDLKRVDLPQGLAIALAKLPRLRSVMFFPPILARSALPSGFPALSILNTDRISINAHLETFLKHSKVQEVQLSVDGFYQANASAPEVGLVPWTETLRSLSFGSAGDGSPHDMAVALRDCVEQARSLPTAPRLTRLAVTLFEHDEHVTYCMGSGLQLAAYCQCPEFYSYSHNPLAHFTFAVGTPSSFPSVQILVVETQYHLYKDGNLKDLLMLVKRLPNLTTLRFGYIWLSPFRLQHSIEFIDDFTLASECPAFFAFLHCLVKTTVHELYIDPVTMSGAACWRREDTTSSFERQAWTWA